MRNVLILPQRCEAREKPAWYAGFGSRLHDLLRSDNPYPANTDEYADWVDGWYEADHLVKLDYKGRLG